ncbi:MAG: tetratricopeptide repeat protein [bacterium]|nr:tetratricopeptide repeat protein [bacterium]
MHFLKSPKAVVVLGAVVLAALVVLAGREAYLRRTARILPSNTVELAPERRKELSEQVAASQAVIRTNPQDFNAHVELALAHTELGNLEGAAEVYRTMNQRFPGNFLSYQNLGQLYEQTGKYAMAAEQYLIAIQNAPRNPHEYRFLVNLYTYKMRERAFDIPRILQQGLAVNPGSIDLMGMLAVHYRDQGNREEAIKWYELLLVHDQSNTTALEELKQLKAQLP